jgi:hypothetical protein
MDTDTKVPNYHSLIGVANGDTDFMVTIVHNTAFANTVISSFYSYEDIAISSAAEALEIGADVGMATVVNVKTGEQVFPV